MFLFQTKYGPGTTLYAPRCYLERREITVTVDEHEYTRWEEFYEGRVKKKTISKVRAVVDINGDITTMYQTDEDTLWYIESYFDKMYPNIEAARMIAADHEKHKSVYYG
jgi:hypothetical protein